MTNDFKFHYQLILKCQQKIKGMPEELTCHAKGVVRGGLLKQLTDRAAIY